VFSAKNLKTQGFSRAVFTQFQEGIFLPKFNEDKNSEHMTEVIIAVENLRIVK
jgi:hypothetical protein